MGKRLSAKGYQRVINALWQVYNERVCKIAYQIRDNTIDTFLNTRGWLLTVEEGTYHLFDHKGNEVVCSEIISEATKVSDEVKYICQILELKIPGMESPLGSLMGREG